MSGADITVLVFSVMAVAGLGWYFFAPRKGRIATPGDGVQKIAVTVRGGYSPKLIHVRQGVPLEIGKRTDLRIPHPSTHFSLRWG